VWFAKSIEFYRVRRELTRGLTAIAGERSFSEAFARLGDNDGLFSALIREALRQLRLSAEIADKAGIKERIASRLAHLEVRALATIGATAPFVGLSRTIWGIMNSFVGISKVQRRRGPRLGL
jgi:biopolymer transport protein ExbB